MSTPISSNLAEILMKLKGTTQSVTKLDQNCNTNDGNDEETLPDSCNCRKSRCLKLYCQCFASKNTCCKGCRCIDCRNTDSMHDIRKEAVKLIEQRNPFAFDEKFKQTTEVAGQQYSSNGCKCRKSMCLKKYCECYQASVSCAGSCTCVDCHNTIALRPSNEELRKKTRSDDDNYNPNYSLLHCQNSQDEAFESKSQTLHESQTIDDSSSNSSKHFPDFSRDKYVSLSKPAILTRKHSLDHYQKSSSNNAENAFQKIISLPKKQVTWNSTNVDVASTLADLGTARPHSTSYKISMSEDAIVLKENNRTDVNSQMPRIECSTANKNSGIIDTQLVGATLNHNLI